MQMGYTAARLAGVHLLSDPILKWLRGGFIAAVHDEHTLPLFARALTGRLADRFSFPNPIFQFMASRSDSWKWYHTGC